MRRSTVEYGLNNVTHETPLWPTEKLARKRARAARENLPNPGQWKIVVDSTLSWWTWHLVSKKPGWAITPLTTGLKGARKVDHWTVSYYSKKSEDDEIRVSAMVRRPKSGLKEIADFLVGLEQRYVTVADHAEKVIPGRRDYLKADQEFWSRLKRYRRLIYGDYDHY